MTVPIANVDIEAHVTPKKLGGTFPVAVLCRMMESRVTEFVSSVDVLFRAQDSGFSHGGGGASTLGLEVGMETITFVNIIGLLLFQRTVEENHFRSSQ